MKVIYTNRAMNKRKDPSPSLKSIILMSALIACMVAVKVLYTPERGMEEVAAMAEISGETLPEETEEMRNAEYGVRN